MLLNNILSNSNPYFNICMIEVVTHCHVPKPSSQAVHIAPADSEFDKLLVELLPMGTQPQTLSQPQY